MGEGGQGLGGGVASWADFQPSSANPQTYIGPVLVSVNPYRDLQIYSRQHMERYRGVSFYEVPPHL